MIRETCAALPAAASPTGSGALTTAQSLSRTVRLRPLTHSPTTTSRWPRCSAASSSNAASGNEHATAPKTDAGVDMDALSGVEELFTVAILRGKPGVYRVTWWPKLRSLVLSYVGRTVEEVRL